MENKAQALGDDADFNEGFAQAVELVRKGMAMIELAANKFEGDLPELFASADLRFTPSVFAQLFMEHGTCLGQPLNTAQKVFWVEAADWMGPDYVEGFRRIGGFMAKTGEF